MVRIHRLNAPEADSSPVALVLPGAGYTVQAPVLYWSVRALAEAGWDVWGIDWHSDIDEAVRQDMRGFVESAVLRAEETLPGPPELVIAKSFGTFGLPHFAHQDIRAAWLTPIFTDPTVAGALASVSVGSHLAVGGTADPAWRPDLVGETRARLVTVEGADHALEVPSAGWHRSAQQQLQVVDRVTVHLLG